MSLSILSWNATSAASQKETENEKTNQKNDSNQDAASIYAGNLNLTDSISDKKVQAGRDAMKCLLNTLQNDEVTTNSLDTSRADIKSLQQENQEYQKNINEMNDQIDSLKTQYGVTGEAGEVVDSDYQTQVESINDQKSYIQSKIDGNQRTISAETSSIRATKIEMLKTHDMVDAQKSVQDILASASDEIKGMLLDEAKDQIDEKTEDVQEKINKNQQDAEDKKIENQKSDNKNSAQQSDSVSNSNQTGASATAATDAQISQEKLQSDIVEIMSVQQMTEDDIKGLEVDENI